MQLIIDDQIVEDRWLAADEQAESLASNQIATLIQWLAEPTRTAVLIQPGDDIEPLLADTVLSGLQLVAVNFPDLTDGRGFSIGRAFREAGFRGELRATGRFIRDQLHYLRRCGFNAFDLPLGTSQEAARKSLYEFSISYQAAQDQPEPLFKRMR